MHLSQGHLLRLHMERVLESCSDILRDPDVCLNNWLAQNKRVVAKTESGVLAQKLIAMEQRLHVALHMFSKATNRNVSNIWATALRDAFGETFRSEEEAQKEFSKEFDKEVTSLKNFQKNIQDQLKSMKKLGGLDKDCDEKKKEHGTAVKGRNVL